MINPYNFVRADQPMPRAEPNGHDRLRGRSGMITCRLETVTPIFTPDFAFRSEGSSADLRFFRIDNHPALPGSSLKGMLRCLAETICNGCSPFDNRSCRSVNALCPACRLFGYLKGGQVHAGHLNITDALVEDGYQIGSRVTLKELSSPKTRHQPFYYAVVPKDGERKLQERGRKFYYHHQHVQTADTIPTEARPTHRNVRIEPLLQGVFDFAVHYWNIGEIELGLLLHTLELPPELYHKFGMAKPLGLGTVRITIVGWREESAVPTDPAARYRSFEVPATNISLQKSEGEALTQAQTHLRARLDPLKRLYSQQYSQALGQQPVTDDLWALPAQNIQDLRIMLSLVNHAKDIRYPDYGWFRRHGSTLLPTVDEVHRGIQLPNT